MEIIRVDKIGSAAYRLGLGKTVAVRRGQSISRVGDVVAVRALSESVTYGNIELPDGRLARVTTGDVLVGVLGNRRALKGFVGEAPAAIKDGDRLSLLNMGGLVGVCSGHHSSFSDAISVEVIGVVLGSEGQPLNIGSFSIPLSADLPASAPIILVGGTCMNSGKTVAATELIKQARNAGLSVAGAKLSGVACLRDTLNMQDHGAVATASFVDCGLPSTVGCCDLSTVARTLIAHLNESKPDLIVAELGDGVVGGYSVEKILKDDELMKAVTSFVFCGKRLCGRDRRQNRFGRPGHKHRCCCGQRDRLADGRRLRPK